LQLKAGEQQELIADNKIQRVGYLHVIEGTAINDNHDLKADDGLELCKIAYYSPPDLRDSSLFGSTCLQINSCQRLLVTNQIIGQELW
jgi:hypothetical protein